MGFGCPNTEGSQLVYSLLLCSDSLKALKRLPQNSNICGMKGSSSKRPPSSSERRILSLLRTSTQSAARSVTPHSSCLSRYHHETELSLISFMPCRQRADIQVRGTNE